jgi:hypothetical protein
VQILIFIFASRPVDYSSYFRLFLVQHLLMHFFELLNRLAEAFEPI